jgi:hypothetical protein
MSDARTSPRRIESARRRLQAVELRRAGATFEQIGQALGCTRMRAWQLVAEEMARLNKERTEAAEGLLALECDRLDALHLVLWPKAMKGDLDAIDRLIKLSARRCRMLGLDATPSMNVGVNRLVPMTLNIIEETVDGPTAQVGGNAGATPPAQCTETISDF